MKIAVHIERLVLEGFPLTGAQGQNLQVAVEAELGRLLAAHGLSHQLRSGGALPHIGGGAIQVGLETTPKTLGTQIAAAIHGGIGTTR